jgi:hypothetical protein|tara:strand:- start:323 stop:1696 length:1374 start_codon:yes stop_codon:yes gene_type:complete
MARNPLYPVSAGETAVDRLLNQTLPRIIADKEAANERQQVRDDALAQQSIENTLAKDKFAFEKVQAQEARTERLQTEAFNNASVILEQAETVTDPAQKAKLYEKAGEYILKSGRNPSDFGIGETGAITQQIRGTIESDTSYDEHKIHLDPSTNQSSTEAEISKAYFAVAKIKNTLSDTNKTEFENFVGDWETIDDTRFDFYKRPEYAQSTIDTIQTATKDSNITVDYSSVPPEFRKEITEAIVAERSGLGNPLYEVAPTSEDINAYYEQNYNPFKLANESGNLYLGEWYETLDTAKERTTYLSNIPIDQAVVDARNIVYALSVTKKQNEQIQGEALRKAAVEFGIPEKVLLQISDEFEVEPEVITKTETKEEKAKQASKDKKREDDKLALYGGAFQGGGMNSNRFRSIEQRTNPGDATRIKAEANIQAQIEAYNKKYPEAKVTFEEIQQLYRQANKR